MKGYQPDGLTRHACMEKKKRHRLSNQGKGSEQPEQSTAAVTGSTAVWHLRLAALGLGSAGLPGTSRAPGRGGLGGSGGLLCSGVFKGVSNAS